MKVNKQFSARLDALIAIGHTYDPMFMSNEEKELLIDNDGKLIIHLDRCLAAALFTAVDWAKQNIEDFEPKSYCVMCGTHLTTNENENALCDCHIRLKASGLVCVWGYEDDDGWEFYCAERVYKENLCDHHYARKQNETPEALYDEAEKALERMRTEANS